MPVLHRGHAKQALRAGATREEVMEAVWVAAECVPARLSRIESRVRRDERDGRLMVVGMEARRQPFWIGLQIATGLRVHFLDIPTSSHQKRFYGSRFCGLKDNVGKAGITKLRFENELRRLKVRRLIQHLDRDLLVVMDRRTLQEKGISDVEGCNQWLGKNRQSDS